jgi:hypothetical protein
MYLYARSAFLESLLRCIDQELLLGAYNDYA